MATRPTLERIVDAGSVWGQLGSEPQRLIPKAEFDAAMAAWQQSQGQNPQGGAPTAVQSGAQGMGSYGMGAPGGVGDPNQISSQLGFAAGVADPWAMQRGQYQAALNDLMQGGSSAVANDPSVRARMDAGQNELARSMVARGFLGSGNILEEIQKKGQDIASQEYGNQFNRLAMLAGVNAGSPGAAGQILANIPGTQLSAQQQGFNQNVESQRLPYELTALQQGATQGGIQTSMLQQSLSDMLRAANQRDAALQQQINAPVQYQSGTQNLGVGNATRPIYTFGSPSSLDPNMITSGGMTVAQILAQRKAAAGY